jgi:hypothetical protein
MNRICKVILAAAAVAALAAPAMATPGDLKLKVRDDGNTADVFTVSNTGAISAAGGLSWNPTSKLLGIGATPDRPVVIDSNSNPLAQGNSSFMLTGEKNTERFELRSFRAATSGPQPTFQGMAAMGTTAIPSSVVATTNLFSLIGFGWNGMAYGGTNPASNSGAALIGMYASETHIAGNIACTASNTPFSCCTGSGAGTCTASKGAYIAFQTTKELTTTRNEKLRINGDGSIRLSNQPAPPVSGTTACTAGDMILDAPGGFLYLCTVTGNTWKKATFN